MTFKKWIVGSPDRESAKKMASELGRDPFSVMLAQLRGINDINELDYFMSDELLISSPDELIDIQIAADTVNEYIAEGLKIAVFGDYDCDGVCASAIMYKYLVSRGADIFVYIPNRVNEGYGMNKSAIDRINEEGCKLIITVDNGISCKDEVDYAASLGIVTVVTDHHLPPLELPDAVAVVDPNREDCPSSFKQICGAEVAFKLVCKIDDKEPEELIDDYVDLLAIATLGDSMPLVKENHSIIKYGIKKIKKDTSPAINAILSVAGIEKSTLDSGKIAYGIVPRINAAGRMREAKKAFELLTTDNIMAAIKLANELEQDNIDRQKTEKDIVASVIADIESNGYEYDRIIVVSGRDYHIGVLGIVASKICEKYGKPSIILSSDGENSVGSCRSVGDFNIYNAIKHCERYLVKFGGHALAAGLTVKDNDLSDFRAQINKYAATMPATVPVLNLDFKLNPASISVDMVYAIRKLEPFGNDNPPPIFGIFGATLTNINEISGGKHLRLTFQKDGYSFSGLLFGVNSEKFPFSINSKLDIAVALELNTYMNKTSVSVFIRGIRPNNIDEEKVITELTAIDDYYSFGIIDKEKLCISRNDIADIYKYLARNEVTTEKLVYGFLDTLGAAKTLISVNILKELSLIVTKNEKLIVQKTEKTDLTKSKTYNILERR